MPLTPLRALHHHHHQELGCRGELTNPPADAAGLRWGLRFCTSDNLRGVPMLLCRGHICVTLLRSPECGVCLSAQIVYALSGKLKFCS